MIERWWIADGRAADLQAVAAFDIAAWMALTPQAQVLSTDRQSCAMCVKTVEGAPYFVKWRHTLPRRRRKTLLRPSRERREARNAARAHALGIPGPVAWAVAERRGAGCVVASLLVRGFDTTAQPATEVLAADPEAVALLATQLAAWHSTGWRHGDAYPKNILLLDDRTTFAPIGYASARFGGRARDAAQARDLAQMRIGLRDPGIDRDPDAFLEAYASAAGTDAASLRAALAPVETKILRKKAERARTRPAREPDGPPRPEPLDASTANNAAMRRMIVNNASFV